MSTGVLDLRIGNSRRLYLQCIACPEEGMCPPATLEASNGVTRSESAFGGCALFGLVVQAKSTELKETQS